ncbi:MAG TPA: POTRA domain-containing protein [Acidocella sp.]|nr:POTRA domain-containing protein [Acidocella sp.]HQU05380.1 POTRA domain-containing protein [Acidocella sp.]
MMNVSKTIVTLPRLKHVACSAMVLGMAALAAAPCYAQAVPVAPTSGALLQQVAPPPLQIAPPGAVITVPAAPTSPNDSKVLIPVSKLAISGNHLIASSILDGLLAPAQGHTLTLTQLHAYVEKITQQYHAAGYPLAYAYLPAQTIHNGVVQVAVVEPKYDQIKVTGQSRFNADEARRTMGVQAGQVVSEAALNRGLLLLNQTPGVQVMGTLLPGAAPQTTTLQLERHDLPLVSGGISENNYGNRYTGTYLTTATATLNDPFGYGSSLSVDGITSQTAGLKAGGFDATSPNLWNGLRVGVYGSSTFYQLGGTFKNLQQVGRQTQVGGDVTYPLILQPDRLLQVRFDGVGNWLAQSTRSTHALSEQMISLERITIDGAIQDRWNGVTNASLAISHGDLAISPGSAKTTDANGPRAAGGFEVAQLSLSRQQYLPAGFVLTGSFNGQVSDKNLDSSQQFYLGGPYGVMSYQVGDGGGDEGYLVTARLGHLVNLPHVPGNFTPALLLQSGTVLLNHNVFKGFTGSNTVMESGVGVGLDYNWQRISVSLAYDHQLGANSSPNVSHSRDQFWFQVNLAL